jgi:hypothetical protein
MGFHAPARTLVHDPARQVTSCGPEGAVDGRLAEGQAGGVRAAQQSVEHVDEVGEHTADARPGVATQRHDAALVGLWMAVNPVFGKPAHDRAWSTRAALGEEQWIAERPMGAAMAVDLAATIALLSAMFAAHQHRAVPAAAATVMTMGLLVTYGGTRPGPWVAIGFTWLDVVLDRSRGADPSRTQATVSSMA